jgi:hypothetical protein
MCRWKRRKAQLAGNGHAARSALDEAKRKLDETMRRRQEIDRLSAEIRRALGVHR